MESKRDYTFRAVLDSRKRKIRGLWKRGDRYYAQLYLDVGSGRKAPRRVPLEARTMDEAKAALEKVRTENRAGALAPRGARPAFDVFARDYIAGPTLAQKKKGTRENETQALKRWIAHLGSVRIDRITATHIHAFREKRLAGDGFDKPATPRTANLDTVALRNCLKLAVERGHIATLPAVRQLKQRPPKRRPLLTGEQFRALLTSADVSRNAALFRFYLRFLALTGAREQEALQLRWSDVDMEREMVTIPISKNSKPRTVDFSPDLRALLEEMQAARPPDSQWLFPSPQRGKKDIHASRLRESLNKVREKAGLAWVGFHDLRHMFASRCVMAGIDFMTIAEWLGHSDRGILVGKVYGHLSDAHKKQAAQKLRLYE